MFDSLMSEALKGLYGPFWNLYIEKDYSDVDFKKVGSIEVAPGTFGVSIMGKSVLGDIWLNPFADSTTIDVNHVGGSVFLDDAWGADISIGFLSGLESSYSWYGSADLGYVGALNFNQSGQWDVQAFYIGEGASFVQSTEINVDAVISPGIFEVLGSTDVDLNLGIANDVFVFVDDESTDTSVRAITGPVEVVDYGWGTSANLGGGSDTFFAGGQDTLVNGGDGFDFFTDGTDGDVVATGFEVVQILNLQGNTVFLEAPEYGTIWFGNVAADFGKSMSTFGTADGNDAVLDVDGGSITVIGGADEYGLSGDFLF